MVQFLLTPTMIMYSCTHAYCVRKSFAHMCVMRFNFDKCCKQKHVMELIICYTKESLTILFLIKLLFRLGVSALEFDAKVKLVRWLDNYNVCISMFYQHYFKCYKLIVKSFQLVVWLFPRSRTGKRTYTLIISCNTCFQ